MDPWKERYARDTEARTLAEVIDGADVFLGLSAARRAEAARWWRRWRAKPLILALANPDARDHARGGRARCAPTPSSPPAAPTIPNQVNNVLCFPYIFRGALDVGATTINDEMKIACVRALAELAASRAVRGRGARLSASRRCGFGPIPIIPKPFDPRLIVSSRRPSPRRRWIRGVATRPIADFDAYRQQLNQFVFTVRPGDAAGVRAARAGAAQARRLQPRARTTACCARCRSCSTSASRGRS